MLPVAKIARKLAAVAGAIEKMNANIAPGNFYPSAGIDAQPEVQVAIERFRRLSNEDRAALPLLYWLLNASTPEFKMSPADAEYQDGPHGSQACGNCDFAFKHVKSGTMICSQISVPIAAHSWCRLWSMYNE